MKIIAKKEFINKAGIPTANCHASTVLPLKNGDVIAAWFGGSREGRDDVDIFVAKRKNSVWSEPQRISADRNIPHWNPVLFGLEDGRTVLYFKVGKEINLVWKTYFVYSENGGESWSEPQELVPGDMSGGRGPVKNKPIYLADGTLIAPASHEPPNGVWTSFCDISKDNGLTWEMSQYIPAGKGEEAIPLIQPTLWQDNEGLVHVLMRSAKGKIFKSDSADNGRTWCEAYDTGLPNPNSGVDCVRDGEKIYLVSNPKGGNWGDRTPLTLSASEDNGKTWKTLLTLEETEIGREEEAEYSYPAITCYKGELYITYTYNRVRIAYWKITIR